jgi:hypothetical protein
LKTTRQAQSWQYSKMLGIQIYNDESDSNSLPTKSDVSESFNHSLAYIQALTCQWKFEIVTAEFSKNLYLFYVRTGRAMKLSTQKRK